MGEIRDANRSKKSIIVAATKLFAKDGFDGVSVDAIAKEAGVNKAMLYYYYKNKSKLYEVVVDMVLEDIYKTVLEKNSQHKKPIDKLYSFIETFAKYAKANPHLSFFMLNELASDGKKLPRDMFLGLRKIFGLLVDILKEGEKKGCFKKTKPIIVHFMIVGAINLFISTKNLRKSVEDELGAEVCNECKIDEVARYLYDYITKGIS